MRKLWKITAVAALIFAACLCARAQTPELPSAPSAPLPAAPAPARPSFTLPAPAVVLPNGSADTKPKPFCFDTPDGLFAERYRTVPDGVKGVLQAYVQNLYSEIFSDWRQHMTLAERNAWGKGRTVAARFAIYPDGTYTLPAITVSSGSERDDAHTLDAIRSHGNFAPLPAGIDHPFPVCVVIGFHRTVEHDPSEWMARPPTAKP